MAKGLAAADLRTSSEEELDLKLTEAKIELFNLRFQAATGQLESHGRLRAVRKELARIYTVKRARELGIVGVMAALGSAAVDNHPMSILNMMALGAHGGSRPLLAALVGGDIGPRLLPIGSLAGLLWMSLLRRDGVEVRIGTFVRLGTLVLLPTLALSLALLWLSPG